LPSSTGKCAILISPPKCLQKHARRARQPEKTKLPGQNLGEPGPLEQRFVSHSPEFSAQAHHPKEGFFTPWVKRLAA
jgi:hypothetical protein